MSNSILIVIFNILTCYLLLDISNVYVVDTTPSLLKKHVRLIIPAVPAQLIRQISSACAWKSVTNIYNKDD